MLAIPDPLHPALIHFPIVLILLGTLVALAAVVGGRRWQLPWLAALLLAGGALGAVAAALTGQQQAEMVGEISVRAEAILDQHEEWGERTRNIAIAAAILALAGAALARAAKTARVVVLLPPSLPWLPPMRSWKPATMAANWYTNTASASTPPPATIRPISNPNQRRQPWAATE